MTDQTLSVAKIDELKRNSDHLQGRIAHHKAEIKRAEDSLDVLSKQVKKAELEINDIDAIKLSLEYMVSDVIKNQRADRYSAACERRIALLYDLILERVCSRKRFEDRIESVKSEIEDLEWEISQIADELAEIEAAANNSPTITLTVDENSLVTHIESNIPSWKQAYLDNAKAKQANKAYAEKVLGSFWFGLDDNGVSTVTLGKQTFSIEAIEDDVKPIVKHRTDDMGKHWLEVKGAKLVLQ